MPYSGNSWQQLVVGLFQLVQCRRAAIRGHRGQSWCPQSFPREPRRLAADGILVQPMIF